MRGVFWYPNAWEDYVDIQSERQLVFRVDDLQVSIIECGSHYGDH